uniref:Uncharacterized protein n=1 Tax=Rhizophora mucronata TaxID=61149 RepID=A0A2P2QKH2_RHIMU
MSFTFLLFFVIVHCL